MTICEKFKLMMASFADIKAAIIEKGVTVTGGYSEYAKNIRKIYSDENYTPEYQYPTEKPPIMQYLINLYNRITFCYAVKQEIRQDGDGYDYAIAKLKKCSDTEYRTVKVEVGREVI